MTAPLPELTVLILTLNEAQALGPFLARVSAMAAEIAPSHEILVIDGNSTDGTADIALKAGARVLMQERPGYGEAYRQGLSASLGEYVLTVDADSAHPLDMVRELWSRRSGYSVVMGSRYLSSDGDARPWTRKWLSLVLNFAYRTFLSCPLTDISGGFRLYRGTDVRAIKSEGPYYDVVAEVIVRLWAKGLPILEIPYHYAPRETGQSKARIIRFGLCYAKTLLNMRRLLSA